MTGGRTFEASYFKIRITLTPHCSPSVSGHFADVTSMFLPQVNLPSNCCPYAVWGGAVQGGYTHQVPGLFQGRLEKGVNGNDFF